MVENHSGIDQEEVRNKYNSLEVVWSKDDAWHQFTRSRISNFLFNFMGELPKGITFKVLNAGSGGNDYGIKGHNQIHVDIAELRLRGIENGIASSVEQVPIIDGQFDICVCVGSVLNYCDAVKAIQEFSRLVKPNGKLILEFETSQCFEFLFKPAFGKKAALVETFYQGERETLWAFSEEYIVEILTLNMFIVRKLERFHQLSPFAYLITGNPNLSSRLARFDFIIRYIPFFRRYCANIILACEKKA